MLELDVPKETVNINFGALHPGRGTAWFDGLEIEVDGKTFDASDLFELSFEGPDPKGFFTGGEGYTVVIDDRLAKAGRKCLRMEFTGSAKPDREPTGPDPKVVSKQCGEIVVQMEASRGRYVEATSETATDWAIQNARVVHQCMQLAANETPRDESMAKNVKWLLDHAPEDTRIVLWAHNSHVSRGKGHGAGGMGAFLDRWYGKDQVIVGFATGEGRYTAIVKGEGLRDTNRLQPPAPDSYEEQFRATGMPTFILNLGSAGTAGSASDWWTRPHMFRSIGAVAMDSQFFSADVGTFYDAIIYIDETSASLTLPSGGERRQPR